MQNDRCFGVEARLRKPIEFKKVLQTGVRVRHPVLQLAYTVEGDRARLGMTVPKKVLRHAHQRNRIKRLLRESFRHCQHSLPAVHIVAIARHGIGDLSNQEIVEILRKQWSRIGRQLAKS